MPEMTFASYAQGPLGEAIRATENFGSLPAPTFQPSVALAGPAGQVPPVAGPATRLLGPEAVAALQPGTVVRTDPPPGAADVEPNYLACVEVVPAELPWVLTPARATAGRLRPWLVLVVVDAARTPVVAGSPLPFVDADVAELPDLRDSWAWAHVQTSTGAGGQIPAGTLARLLCPRRLTAGTTYRACLVPAFASGRAAGLGSSDATPHDPAWNVDSGGVARLPVYHSWTFTTGPDGDFEQLVTRLRPADPEALRVASARPVDVRQPWPGDTPLSESPQLLGVSGALRPFTDPPVPDDAATPAVLAALDTRLRAQLDAPAERLESAPPDDTVGAVAPPLYGGRHVNRDRVGVEPGWLAGLNLSVANRIAAGLGAEYVRANQEDLMAKAWAQVGAIREANRRRAIVELTTVVAERVHERHVTTLVPGELVALAAPAAARTRTSGETSLAMEVRMSRLADGIATSAFARRLRPAGKLARRTAVTVGELVPRGLVGAVTVPLPGPVIPPSPRAEAAPTMPGAAASLAARQLIMMSAVVRVAAVNAVGGAEAMLGRVGELGLDGRTVDSIGAGDLTAVSAGILGQVDAVAAATAAALADLPTGNVGELSTFGVAVAADEIAARLTEALAPGGSHHARLASQTTVPDQVVDHVSTIMAAPVFPVPTALALLETTPEWFLPGLGKFPANRVALLRQNAEFIESYLVGANHELMRELLWREYPTDQRGTPFRRFWPRPDGSADVPPVPTWTAPLGGQLAGADRLSVLLVRGDVLRRYPGTVVTAVPAAIDESGRLRPDPAASHLLPLFGIRVDESTTAFGFEIAPEDVTAEHSAKRPAWFFVFAEHSHRIRFGFDEPSEGEVVVFDTWNDLTWPSPAFASPLPVVRGHAFAGAALEPPALVGADGPFWNRDAADIARIALQRPFRVAIQATVLIDPSGGV